MSPRPYQPQWRHHEAHITPVSFNQHQHQQQHYSYPPPFVTPYSAPSQAYNPYYYDGTSPHNIARHYPNHYNMARTSTDETGGRPSKKSKPNAAAASSSPLAGADDKSKAAKAPAVPGKGLRHFSMKICERVKGKGTTSYNEVADELIKELREEEARAYAAANSESKKKRSKPPASKYDEKNIRRRVYDALNVLMAMDIIVKDKKMIVWNGLPGNRTIKDSGNKKPKSHDTEEVRSKKISEQLQRLKDERSRRQAEVQRKREILQELITQNVCFNNLYQRNHAREVAELTSTPPQTRGEKNQEEEKIPLPFIVVNTNHKAVIQCEMCPQKTNVSFDFTMPFEINDDNEILKRIGMDRTTNEELQRALPPDLYRYCSTKGLLENISSTSCSYAQA